jgi:hypothetical protein
MLIRKKSLFLVKKKLFFMPVENNVSLIMYIGNITIRNMNVVNVIVGNMIVKKSQGFQDSLI